MQGRKRSLRNQMGFTCEACFASVGGGSGVLSFSQVVSVAQPVEHRSVEPRVVGSNPIAHPKPQSTSTV